MDEEYKLNELFNAYSYIFAMLKDRGHGNLSPYTTVESFAGFISGITDVYDLGDKLTFTVDKYVVYFLIKSAIKEDIENMLYLNEKYNDFILVHLKPLTIAVKNDIKLKKTMQKKNIVPFLISTLQDQQTKKADFPKRIWILNNDERNQLLGGITTAQNKEPINALPLLLTDDFMSVYLGAKRGDIIGIYDNSLLKPGEMVYEYRHVANKRKK